MKWNPKPVIAAFVLLSAPMTSFAQTPGYLRYSEIMKMLEASDLNYRFVGFSELDTLKPEESGSVLFPEFVQHVKLPVVERSDSGINLTSFLVDSAVQVLTEDAERFYWDKKYKKARKKYEAALKLQPDAYFLELYIGDTFLMEDNPSTALEHYERAKLANPMDYRCYMFPASALMRLGRMEEALDSYISALVLKPRHKNLLLILEGFAPLLNVSIRNVEFVPKAVVFEKEGGVDIFVATEQDHGVWIGYATAKAAVLGEVEFRKRLTGDESKGWSSVFERQAIMTTMEFYLSGKADRSLEPIPQLDAIAQIAEGGYFGEYIVYEIASRMHPDVTLTLPDEARSRIRSFIEKYVVVKN